MKRIITASAAIILTVAIVIITAGIVSKGKSSANAGIHQISMIAESSNEGALSYYDNSRLTGLEVKSLIRQYRSVYPIYLVTAKNTGTFNADSG